MIFETRIFRVIEGLPVAQITIIFKRNDNLNLKDVTSRLSSAPCAREFIETGTENKIKRKALPRSGYLHAISTSRASRLA